VDPGSGVFLSLDPGWKKIRIRGKHPGSSTLLTIKEINTTCLADNFLILYKKIIKKFYGTPGIRL
jgi:predicted oxidoreductase